MKSLLGQFARFAVVGGLSAVLHYAVLIALVSSGITGPVLASGAGFVISAGFNYWLNYRFTFNSRRGHAAAAPRFAAVSIVGLLINQAVVIALLHFKAHYLLAQVVATGCVMIWNFVLGRIFTFGGAQRVGHGS